MSLLIATTTRAVAHADRCAAPARRRPRPGTDPGWIDGARDADIALAGQPVQALRPAGGCRPPRRPAARASSLTRARSSWLASPRPAQTTFFAAGQVDRCRPAGVCARAGVARQPRLDKGASMISPGRARCGWPRLENARANRGDQRLRQRAFHPHRAAAKDHVAGLDAAPRRTGTASTSVSAVTPRRAASRPATALPRRVDPTSSPHGLLLFHQPGQGGDVIVDQRAFGCSSPNQSTRLAPRASGLLRLRRAGPAPARPPPAALAGQRRARRRSARPAGPVFPKIPRYPAFCCHAVAS